MRNGINVRLDGPDDSRICWHVHDPVDGDGWTDAQLDFIRRLLPHIRQFVQVQQTLAGAGVLGTTLTELLDAAGMGIVQLDAGGRIVAANDRIQDLQRAGDTLFDEKGFLFARTPADNSELQSLLTHALPRYGTKGAGGSMTIARAGGLPPLVVHVNPVGPPETDFAVWPVSVLVLVSDPAGGTSVAPDAAAAALGLTGMESRVAVLLAQGMSVREIVAATGRREFTIRTHVRNMFAKLGLSRQADLVRLVRSLAGTVSD